MRAVKHREGRLGEVWGRLGVGALVIVTGVRCLVCDLVSCSFALFCVFLLTSGKAKDQYKTPKKKKKKLLPSESIFHNHDEEK